MIEQYDELASKSGSRIINCCGLDSIPWDLLVWGCNSEFLKREEKLKKVEIYDQINGEFSGGTFATLLHSLSNPPPRSQLGYDPLVK